MSDLLVAARALGVRYGERWLVQALDLEVRPGQRWVIVGPNGAGKSSLLLTLAGVRGADDGALRFEDEPAGQWGVQRLAALRAVVADRWVDPFPVSVLEMVVAARYHLRATGGSGAAARAREQALQCLAQMDCAALAARDVRTLSRGERQRVAIAAAMAQQTRLLLLDEPISHQDPRHQVHVLERLAAWRQGTCIAVLHDINAAVRFGTHALLLYGDGRWEAGEVGTVLVPPRLSRLFGTEITEVLVAAQRVFVSMGGAPA